MIRNGWLGRVILLILAGIARGQQRGEPDGFQPTDIFITRYQRPSVADASAYHNSKLGRKFEAELQADDDERFCFQAPILERAAGGFPGAKLLDPCQ